MGSSIDTQKTVFRKQNSKLRIEWSALRLKKLERGLSSTLTRCLQLADREVSIDKQDRRNYGLPNKRNLLLGMGITNAY